MKVIIDIKKIQRLNKAKNSTNKLLVKCGSPNIRLTIKEAIADIKNSVTKDFIILGVSANFLSLIVSLKATYSCNVGKNINAKGTRDKIFEKNTIHINLAFRLTMLIIKVKIPNIKTVIQIANRIIDV
ncbi:MAG: hypothetical protein ACFE9T_15380 [Promethearchaeota archaeon]